MTFIKSSNGPGGIIDPAGSYNPGLDYEHQIKANTSYLIQLPGIFLTILVISSLFIFIKFYLNTTKKKIFRYTLGIFLIIDYSVYYALHVVYLAVVLKTPNGTTSIHPSLVRSLAEAIPIHICSIQQIMIGILLIGPNKKLFSITAPWGMMFLIVAVIAPPSSKYGSLDNMGYGNYFLLHFVILFGYLYLYLYDFVKYDIVQLRGSYISLIAFSIATLVGDVFFDVDLMQVGPKRKEGQHWIPGGFSVGKYNTNDPFGGLPMFAFGTVIGSLNHVLLAKLPQLYTYDLQTKSFTNVNWKTTKTSCHLIAFKGIFCSKKVIEKDKLRIASKQQLRKNNSDVEVQHHTEEKQSNE